jgi:hypothetical protein
MKKIIMVFAMLASFGVFAATYSTDKIHFETIKWKCGGSGSQFDSVVSAAGTHTMFTLPAYSVVENVYMLVKKAVAGSTGLTIGDAGNTDGYLETGFYGSTGMFPSYKSGATSSYAGDYLNPMALYSADNQANGKKFYSTATALQMVLTGTCTAGEADIGVAFRVFNSDLR